MARKKSAAAIAARNQDAVNPQTKPKGHESPNSADAAAAATAEKKILILKNLNDILLKQLMELREKEKRAADAALLSAYEREIALFVLSAQLSDGKTCLERQTAMKEQLMVVADEKVELTKALELALSDREGKAKADAEKISALVEELRAVYLDRDRLEVEFIDSKKAWKSVEEERLMLLKDLKSAHVDYDILMKEKEDEEWSNKLKIKGLAQAIDRVDQERAEQEVVIASTVEKLRCIELARDRLVDGLRSLKDVFESVKEELERGRAELVDELERVRIDFYVLIKEKKKSEKRFGAQMEELKKEMAEQGVVISAQAEELQNLALAGDQLQATLDSMKEELEQERANVLTELKRVRVDFDLLKLENEQFEQSFNSQVKELVAQQGVIEREKTQQGVVIAAQVEVIRRLVVAKGRLEAELREAVSLMEDLEQGRSTALDELKTEDEQSEHRLKLAKKEFAEQMDLLNTDVSKLGTQMDAMERERAEQEVENAGLEIHQGELNTERSVIVKEIGAEENQYNKMETEVAGAKKNGRFFAWFVPAASTVAAILAAGLTIYSAKRR